MTTMETFLRRVRHIVEGDQHTEVNIVNEILDASETDVTFLDAITGLKAGDLFEVDTELFYVRSSATPVATVIRGWRGTTAAAHANLATAFLRPWLDMGTLLEYAKDEIQSWPSSMFAVADFTLPVSHITTPLDLELDDNGLREVLTVEIRRTDGTYAKMGDGRMGYRLIRNGIDSVPILHFYNGVECDGQAIITYAKDFNLQPFDMTTNIEQSIGLTTGTLDILLYGVMWRALIGKEGRRLNLDAHGVNRADEAIAVGDGFRVGGAYKGIRDLRIAEEVARLRRKYGIG